MEGALTLLFIATCGALFTKFAGVVPIRLLALAVAFFVTWEFIHGRHYYSVFPHAGWSGDHWRLFGLTKNKIAALVMALAAFGAGAYAARRSGDGGA